MPHAGAAPEVRIVPATAADVPLVLRFIRELAEFEKIEGGFVADEEKLRRTLFGPSPTAEVLLAYAGGEPVGCAIFFHNYSTILAQPGLYLEDVYVRPEARGQGVGRRLLVHLARLAVERGCGRFEWSVLDWNTGAIRFYESLGAVAMDEWTTYRVSGEALARLAAEG
ncbi:MAG: GNAT family N-acetyltransferase [Thermoanaerobaculia bacterium]